MRFSFKIGGGIPIDRPFNFSQDEKNFNALTLGSCSYISGMTVDYVKSPHILIGRFCSLAEGINLVIGLNHEYKNVVTTYPFDAADIVKNIRVSANLPETNYIPRERRYDNHYQIIVGNDVWIGQGATIRGGVKIGSGAIIGTNAMVTKDVPPYAIAAGNPARVVKYRFDAETIKKFMAVKWWNWSIEKIYHNFPRMRNAADFLAEHYAPELNRVPYEKLGGAVYRRLRNIAQITGRFIHLWQISGRRNHFGGGLSEDFCAQI